MTKLNTKHKKFLEFVSKARLPLFIASFALVGAIVLIASQAASPYDDSYRPKENRAKGEVFTNLRKTTRFHKCKGLFEASSAKTLAAKGTPLCTHGPDEAKSDMPTKVAKLDEVAKKPPSKDDQETLVIAKTVWDGTELSPFSLPDQKCIGTGSDGQRVQLIYAYQQGQANNSATYTPLVKFLGRWMDADVVHSHSGVGSDVKRIRWVTDSTCAPTVISVAVPSGADFGGMVDYLYNRGYSSNSRKYMVFVDYSAPDAYCGLGGLYSDDKASTSNDNNTYQSWAAVTKGCWGSGEIHEMFHVFGAVQDTAPHATGAGHCLDGYDVMCRGGDRGDGYGMNGKKFNVICNKSTDDNYYKFLLDCNHDDYFSTARSVPGYLGSHWNTAKSGFLATDGGVGYTLSMTPTPSGNGYWISNVQGDITPYGDASYYGSLLGNHLAAGIVSVDSSISGNGYYMLGADGGVFTFGDAVFKGSAAGRMTNTTAVGLAVTSTGKGYWIVDAKGGLYAFGDASFKGSAYGKTTSPIVGIQGKSTSGYLLQSKDGGVFAFGTAVFKGSAFGHTTTAGSIATDVVHGGYWIAANDGGVFAEAATYYGSMGGRSISAPVVSIAARPQGDGYWLLGADGAVYSFGGAHYYGRY